MAAATATVSRSARGLGCVSSTYRRRLLFETPLRPSPQSISLRFDHILRLAALARAWRRAGPACSGARLRCAPHSPQNDGFPLPCILPGRAERNRTAPDVEKTPGRSACPRCWAAAPPDRPSRPWRTTGWETDETWSAETQTDPARVEWNERGWRRSGPPRDVRTRWI